MKKDYTLFILAAGMGSRFGGLKQVEPVGPQGEFLIDYSIYDAIRAGFTKVVFVIKKEHEEIFKKTIGNRISNYIKVEYAFQGLEEFVEKVPEGRVKPWGTAHAILCAKDLVKEPFLIINSDDFYGMESYQDAMKKLKESDSYFTVGYPVINTLSEHGAVKRGVCFQKEGELTSLIESSIEEKNGTIVASPLNGSPSFEIEKDTLVSMNMLGLNPTIFPYLEKNFKDFLSHLKDECKDEYLIPDILMKAKEENYHNVSVIPTHSKWFGMTYRSDTEAVKQKIKTMTEDGIYPNPLWK